jgi:hypothetical protein
MHKSINKSLSSFKSYMEDTLNDVLFPETIQKPLPIENKTMRQYHKMCRTRK